MNSFLFVGLFLFFECVYVVSVSLAYVWAHVCMCVEVCSCVWDKSFPPLFTAVCTRQSLSFNPELTLASLVTFFWAVSVCLQSVEFTGDHTLLVFYEGAGGPNSASDLWSSCLFNHQFIHGAISPAPYLCFMCNY